MHRLDCLSTSIQPFRLIQVLFSGRWLVPPKPSAAKSWYQTFQEKLPHHFTASYWKNNKPFLLTLYSIIGINIILMVQRAYYFKDFAMLNGYTPNPFYMISRACGKWFLRNMIQWPEWLTDSFGMEWLTKKGTNIGYQHKHKTTQALWSAQPTTNDWTLETPFYSKVPGAPIKTPFKNLV